MLFTSSYVGSICPPHITKTKGFVNIPLHLPIIQSIIGIPYGEGRRQNLPLFRHCGAQAGLTEKLSVMAIPPQFVIGLFFFIADTFPDHSSVSAVEIPALVVRAKHGDRSAVTLLYQIHSDRIFRYVVMRVPTVADAEDLTAEVFIRMVEGLPTFQVTGVPFEAWLYRIASSRITDFYRQNSRRPHTELHDSLSDSALLPEEQIEQQQTLEQLRAALRQLEEEHQLILTLRFVERKSHQEVAQILGKSVPAIKSSQHRALIHLTELLGSNHKARHYLRGSHE
jgi:RNA polymerase sigma-70 factor (ECF subfamily)